MKKLLIIIMAIIMFTAVVYAAFPSVRPDGIATPKWYSYSSGAIGTYYLEQPTLTANDQVVTEDTTQTLTNKTLTSPTVTSPTITGGTATDATLLDFVATELTATGAIPADVSYVELNHATVKIEATIAAPAAGRLLVITQTDAGTAAHTVTLTAGTYNGTNDIATFNAAAESLVLFGVSATRFLVVENIGSVALSGT